MGNTKRYLLAHDLGTSGNKATLFTVDGKLVASRTSPYETNFFNNNWAEQNPADWWRAVCVSSRELLADIDAGEIAAVCFSGQMMGCLCVDREGRPLKESIIYCDQRAGKETSAILSKIGEQDFYRITGHRASPSYSVEKLLWIKNNQPDIYRKTYKMLHAKDYINFKLTGRMVSEPTDASGTNLFDLNANEWSARLIEITGIDPDKLPEVAASTALIGEVTREAAEATGLAAGTPVVAGAGDGICAAVGVGSVKPGVTYNYLGSSSWIATTTAKPIYDEAMRTFVWAHAVPGFVHPCGTMQTAGSSYAWLKNEVCKSETEEAVKKGVSPYQLINEKIALSPPGARGLLFLPYLLGERSPRWNPNARGGWIGLKLEHKREDLLRAVLEGITLNLNVILTIFRTQIDISEIRVIGGGAKGEVWRKIMADIYDAEIQKPIYLEEATSMGAAVIGGVGSGVFKDFDAVDRFLTIEQREKPDPKNRAVYDKLKPVFEKSYHALTGVYEDLAGL